MKYERIEFWLETLTGTDKDQAVAAWQDHVEKHLVDENYTPHTPEFMMVWSRFSEANAE
jgi:hypothetical protein